MPDDCLKCKEKQSPTVTTHVETLLRTFHYFTARGISTTQVTSICNAASTHCADFCNSHRVICNIHTDAFTIYTTDMHKTRIHKNA